MSCILMHRFRRVLAVRGRLQCPRVLHLHITEEHRTLLQHMLCRGLVVTLQSIGRPAFFVHLPVKLLRQLLRLLHIGFGRCRLGKRREMALPGDGMPADRAAIARLQIACEDTGLLTEERPVLFFIGSICLLEATHRRLQCLLRRLQRPMLSAERIIVFLQCTELVLLPCIGLLRRLLRRKLCLHTAEGLQLLLRCFDLLLSLRLLRCPLRLLGNQLLELLSPRRLCLQKRSELRILRQQLRKHGDTAFQFFSFRFPRLLCFIVFLEHAELRLRLLKLCFRADEVRLQLLIGSDRRQVAADLFECRARRVDFRLELSATRLVVRDDPLEQ